MQWGHTQRGWQVVAGSLSGAGVGLPVRVMGWERRQPGLWRPRTPAPTVLFLFSRYAPAPQPQLPTISLATQGHPRHPLPSAGRGQGPAEAQDPEGPAGNLPSAWQPPGPP